MSERTIMHADMDAFFASVEQLDRPALRGCPVAVGGAAPRGVVAAASYEARPFGVHSAMPMARAQKCCPDLVVIRPRMARYAEVSRQVFAIFAEFSPLVEPLSLDEAFIDLSGAERLLGPAEQAARELKRRVRERVGLVVSIGVGPSKFIAKIASDLGKPDGLVVVAAGDVERFLHPLPVSRLYGVGAVTAGQLEELGIKTIGALARFPLQVLRKRCGAAAGEHLFQLAHGIDPRDVVVDAAPQSLGHEDTFTVDIDDLPELEQIVREQADHVARRVRKHGLLATVVVLKLKTAAFKLRTRRRTLPRPTCDGAVVGQVACELLQQLKRQVGPVRLCGVTATGLQPAEAPRQLTLDEPRCQQGERLAHVLDEIAGKFGDGAIVRGARLQPTARALRAEEGSEED